MSGKNSALASLTANYTDSEDEEDEPELEINAPKSDLLSGTTFFSFCIYSVSIYYPFRFLTN